MVVLANVCAIALIDFPSSLRFTIACFSPIDSSLHLHVQPFNSKCSLQGKNPKLKLRADIQRFIVWIINVKDTSGQQKTPVTSVTWSDNFAHWKMGGFQTKGGLYNWDVQQDMGAIWTLNRNTLATASLYGNVFTACFTAHKWPDKINGCSCKLVNDENSTLWLVFYVS